MDGSSHRLRPRRARAARRVLLACLVLAGVVAVGITWVRPLVSPGTPSEADRCRGVLVPAYVSPAELAGLAQRRAERRIVIVNPASGSGSTRDPAYAGAVRLLQRGETRVLGYVATGYGSRPADAILAEIDRYSAWYGVDGIFLDETSSDRERLGHYRTLGEAVRTKRGLMVVQNPGVVPDRGYFETADVIVTFEGPHSAYGERRPVPDVPREKVAHLVYAAPEGPSSPFVGDGDAGYVYATPGVLPNPWGRLAPPLDAQEAVGHPCGAA